jgi:hypothetical protein
MYRSRPAAPVRRSPSARRSLLYEPPWWRRLLVPIIALVAIAVIAAVLVVATSSSGGTSSARAGARRSRAAHRRAALIPGSVTVAVLNGTAINHLALDTARALSGHGYRISSTANAPTQTQTTTEVEYLVASERGDALAVARALGLSAGHVVPVRGSDEAVACHSAGACPAKVIVVVGQDLQRLAGTSTTGAAASATTTGASTAGAGSPTTTTGG